MKRLFGGEQMVQPYHDTGSAYTRAQAYLQQQIEPPSFESLVIKPLEQMWLDAAAFLPNVIKAFVILIIGLVIARIFQFIISKFLKSIGFDAFSASIGLNTLIQQSDTKIQPHQGFGKLTFWSIALFTIISSLSQLKLYMASGWMDEFLFFAISVLTAVIFFIFGIFLSIIASQIVLSVAEKLNAPQGKLFSSITKWAVLGFTVLISLRQFGLPAEIVLIVLGGAYITLCITFVIAFGGGGVGWASKVLNRTLEK